MLNVWVLLQVAHGTLSDQALNTVEMQKDLLGASGLLLLLPHKVRSEDVAEEDVYWLSAVLQLRQLLQAKPLEPALPLVVLVPSPGGETMEKEVEEGLLTGGYLGSGWNPGPRGGLPYGVRSAAPRCLSGWNWECGAVSLRAGMCVSLEGLMLQDLISAKLVSDYTIVEIPGCICDLQGTAKVSDHQDMLAYILLRYHEFSIY